MKKLLEQGKLVIGDGYRAKNEELSRIGLPFARAQNIDAGFKFNGADCFPETSLHKIGNKVSQPGDVVFTSKGTVGRFAFVREDTPRFVYSPQLCFWRSLDKDVIAPRWLYYWMHGREFGLQYKGVAGQTDMADYVSLRDQRRMSISLPEPTTQRAIAHILGTLDDMIELNRRMNETLEVIVRAIFKSWFVDFDPVRAKARGEPPDSIYRRLGLTKDLLALLPDHLVGSELGEIPEGWEVKPLELVTSYLNRGISPKYIEAGGVLVLNQKCIRDNRVDSSKGRRHDPMQRSIAGRLLEVGDVLVNSTGVGTLGRVAQVLGTEEPTIVDSHVTVVRANPQQVSWNYLGVALNGREDEIEALGEGSTGQTELSRVRLGGLPMLLPPKPLRDHFDDVVLSLRLRTKRNDEQSVTLASARNTLLPKLISGELRGSLRGTA